MANHTTKLITNLKRLLNRKTFIQEKSNRQELNGNNNLSSYSTFHQIPNLLNHNVINSMEYHQLTHL
jgi:hypothetical protein